MTLDGLWILVYFAGWIACGVIVTFLLEGEVVFATLLGILWPLVVIIGIPGFVIYALTHGVERALEEWDEMKWEAKHKR